MYNELDEQALARACSQRDRLAEEELYSRYAARVYALCRRYLGEDDAAKDLMLETLTQALDKIGAYHYQGIGSLYAWISRIAINKAINRIKRQRWRMVPLDFRTQDNIPEQTESEMEEIPSEKPREWIAGLPDLRRTVFNLYCKMLGISETGSTSALAKARKQLKEKIKQYLKERDQ